MLNARVVFRSPPGNMHGVVRIYTEYGNDAL